MNWRQLWSARSAELHIPEKKKDGQPIRTELAIAERMRLGYHLNFNASWICRDVPLVEVKMPALRT